MKTLVGVAFFSCVAIAMFAQAFLLSPQASLRADVHPDLGTIDETTKFLLDFPIRNISTEDVYVENILLSCWCHQMNPRGFVLKPGEQQVCHMSLDFSINTPGNSPIVPFTVVIRPIIKDHSGEPIKWHLVANVRRLLISEQTAIDFGTRFQSKLQHDVLVKTNGKLEKISATCDLPEWNISVESLADGQSHRVRLSSKDLPAPGVIRGSLFIKPDGGGAEGIPQLKMPISGLIKSSVEVFPPSLLLGFQKVKTSCVESVSVRFPTGSVIKSLETSSPDTKAVFQASSANATMGIAEITQLISKEGAQDLFVDIHFQLPDNSVASARLPISYLGRN